MASRAEVGDTTTVVYPCHWLHEERTLPVGAWLTIFQRGDKARIAVMEGSLAVAEVRGEAARDLKEMFRRHPEMQNCLAVTISNAGQSSEPFYATPVVAKKGRRKPVQ